MELSDVFRVQNRLAADETASHALSRDRQVRDRTAGEFSVPTPAFRAPENAARLCSPSWRTNSAWCAEMPSLRRQIAAGRIRPSWN